MKTLIQAGLKEFRWTMYGNNMAHTSGNLDF